MKPWTDQPSFQLDMLLFMQGGVDTLKPMPFFITESPGHEICAIIKCQYPLVPRRHSKMNKSLVLWHNESAEKVSAPGEARTRALRLIRPTL